MIDDARFYNNIGREFADHETTLHSNREFSRGDGIHSNTAENFFLDHEARRCGHLSPLERAAHSPLLCRVRFPLFDQG
jgi:hypothetical protein